MLDRHCLPEVLYLYVNQESSIASDQTAAPHDTTTNSRRKRYTQESLTQTLQLAGCKPRHASKASAKTFHILRQRAALAPTESYSLASTVSCISDNVASVTLSRLEFEKLVVECLSARDSALSLPDLQIACSIHERSRSITILLCGTSGTGKSTLASLLAARLGITTVISTDSIRNMLKSCAVTDEAEHALPMLWASTYTAGSTIGTTAQSLSFTNSGNTTTSTKEKKKMMLQGYKAQSEAVVSHVERLIAAHEARNQSLILEGVHLSPSLVTRMMTQHPSVVPFLVYISNESKHMERFAVRAKAMSLRPEGNRYIKYLKNIRTIQEYLCSSAEKRSVPQVDNTNVDRSVAAIHATVLGCLRRSTLHGETFIEQSSTSGSGRCRVVLSEYINCVSGMWKSSEMLQKIRNKAAIGEPASSPEGPSTSAASTPKGPLSESGDPLAVVSMTTAMSAMHFSNTTTKSAAGPASTSNNADDTFSVYSSDSEAGSSDVGEDDDIVDDDDSDVVKPLNNAAAAFKRKSDYGSVLEVHSEEGHSDLGD